jgi:hypothetical protein
MSEVSQGPGWWQASDGKWYRPDQHPNYQPPAPTTTAPPPSGAAAPLGPGWWQASDGRWYPPQPGYLPAPGYPGGPKKPVYKRVWFWLLISFAVVIAIIVAIIALIAAAGTAITNANNAKHTIVYSIAGTGTPTITYSSFDNNHNGSTQLSNVPLPWTKTLTGSGLFNVYDVTATLGQDGGTLRCTIAVDGKQVSSNSANGAFSSANCSGSVTP